MNNLFLLNKIMKNIMIIKKEDLNSIIEILFFIKKIGSKTAYSNIDTNCLIDKINNIMKEKTKIDNLSKSIKINNEFKISNKEEDKCIYYQSNEFDFKNINLEDYDLIANLEKNKNVQKINEIKDKILLKLNGNKIKEIFSIEDIIKVIFYGKDEIIFTQSKDFIKLLVEDTHSLMLKYLNFDYQTKLSNELININDFVNLLKRIKVFLDDFEELKIIKHKNLDAYISHKIKDYKNIYSSYILFIEELKYIKMPEMDCTLKEIEAEVCFLFLNKILNNEIQSIKL